MNTRSKAVTLLMASALLTSCASQLTQRVTLAPAPLECQVTEVRTSVLATSVLKLCWDETGRLILATAGEGESIAGAATKAATVGAIAGAGIGVGAGMGKATNVSVRE